MKTAVWLSVGLGLAGCTEPSITNPPTYEPAHIVSVGSSFGLCVGACRSTLTFEDGITLTLEDNRGGAPLAEQRGALTDAGEAELARIDAALDPSSLEEVYGCPDCADGGAMHLVAEQQGVITQHDWELGGPPAQLQDIDALFHDLADALEDCAGSAWIDPDPGCVAFTAP